MENMCKYSHLVTPRRVAGAWPLHLRWHFPACSVSTLNMAIDSQSVHVLGTELPNPIKVLGSKASLQGSMRSQGRSSLLRGGLSECGCSPSPCMPSGLVLVFSWRRLSLEGMVLLLQFSQDSRCEPPRSAHSPHCGVGSSPDALTRITDAPAPERDAKSVTWATVLSCSRRKQSKPKAFLSVVRWPRVPVCGGRGPRQNGTQCKQERGEGSEGV